ncbi:acetyltransferase, GNAT family [Candidatus Rhodobacter oscarellae]|uniref:Acetyltransferase, GNAT family n=1 Tax=Candidatus Rhodobacter oscarellae TaxID=1675527 RepID=A0A0J9E946_9RHOB|nr:GNAT family N-acetyltransferase [Candidatus Rhodobacter lobularis]KMW59315.1 acetyltransferase, GNAT family [Candidatus Rhodobacter lobularis]
MHYRLAQPDDAQAMSNVFTRLEAVGKRRLPSTIAYARETYIDHFANISCWVAEEDAKLVGLQVLKRAWPGNPYDIEPGIGVIGTHIDPDFGRRGIGRGLFAHTLHAAQAAGLAEIEARITEDNAEGLGYYEAIGFRTYDVIEGRVRKKFPVSP